MYFPNWVHYCGNRWGGTFDSLLFGNVQCFLYLQFPLEHTKMEAPLREASFLPKPFYRNPQREPRPVPFHRPLILCIEDDAVYLTLRKAVLEREGYAVIGVTTADDALKTLKETPVCATIADHMLQGTTGTDLAREMKAIKPDVPVILFSGTIPGSLKNVDVYVNKGEPTVELLKVVRNVIERYCS
jgi:CheY-like chemotaxis protein